MTHRLVIVALGVIPANFVYQALAGSHWDVAIDRSWFQATALFIAWLSLRIASQEDRDS